MKAYRKGFFSFCVVMLYTVLSDVRAGAQQLELLADTQNPAGFNAASLKIDSFGNVYAPNYGGLIKFDTSGGVQQLFTTANPDYFIRVSNAPIDAPQSAIPLRGVGSFEVDALGNFYIRESYSDRIIKIAADASVQEITEQDIVIATRNGLGNTLNNQARTAIDQFGDVYYVNAGLNTVSKINQAGTVTVVLDANGVGEHALKSPYQIAIDDENNKYIATKDTVFKISSSGVKSVHLDLYDYLKVNAYSRPEFRLLTFDGFGNIYFIDKDNSNILYRYSADGAFAQILDTDGDGTGELVCAKEGPMEHDPIVCKGYGNYLQTIVGIHIDGAQNVYAVGRRSRNIFKVTPTGLVSEIADFSELDYFNVERISYTEMDSIGNFYFIHAKEKGYGISLFRYSPLPFEGRNDFSIEAPHSSVVHGFDGISSLPANYTYTSLIQDNSLPDKLAHLDTRTEAFSQLPWGGSEGDIQTSVTSTLETTTTTLNYEGRSYVAQMKTIIADDGVTKLVTAITYSADGTQLYAIGNLEFPLASYQKYANQQLMSWLYLGNDVISGGARADILYGYEGHDILYGNGGDDLFDGGSGANIYYGGDGIDTVVYEGRAADYMLSKNPVTGAISVQTKTGLGNPYVDLLEPDVERVQFQDTLIATEGVRYWGELENTRTSILPSVNSVTVYRFFNTRDNAFFYTTNPDERSMLLRHSAPNNRDEVDWPYVFQGAKFQTADTYPGAVPLYRFYNTQTGHHFFTINETERAQILANIQNHGWPFVDEGVAFEVYAEDPTPGEVGRERPVYRYYSWSLNRHIFTSSEKESASLDASRDWTYEGIGFYAEGLQ